jgi:hypothetical protein
MRAATSSKAVLACAVLALSACATRGESNSFPDPEENTGVQTTRYELEFVCPRDSTFRISGTTTWSDKDDGFLSRVTQIRVGRRAIAQHWLDEINQRIPQGAYHERPWLTCSGDGAEVEIRFIDRSNGSVALSPRVIFILRGDGTLEFLD